MSAELDAVAGHRGREDLAERVVRVLEGRLQEVLDEVRRRPSTAGTPRKPARIEPTARICSGTIIVFGDSWTCFACSAVPRKLPPKVIQ